ncbi:hypothetical protein E2986_10898 [Frieseomelitta varia]|uniref:Uncharacterized protein n=1 Tax=Frieseomelitta varia TaxID=561572 RepID=A0A833W5A0_9HYME|nr:hypothetical protein E2986_10898 [Frieseomelitta varia]
MQYNFIIIKSNFSQNQDDNDMEMHKNPNTRKNSLRGDEMTLKEPHRNGSTYGAFQSKDPILAVEKGAEMEGGSDEHGISVHHPTS